MTFANFPEEKLHTCAFFCGADYLGLARNRKLSISKLHKIITVSFTRHVGLMP